jgi:hypothetical protein
MMLGNKHQSCGACGRNLDAVPLAPQLHDEVWKQFAKQSETLCADCFLERAAERRVDLSLQDLRPCPFNLYGIPSWYDLFHAEGALLPSNIDAWRSAAAALAWLEEVAPDVARSHLSHLF